MGIYMMSHALIGVKFTPTSTSEKVRVRGCNHAETNDAFCSNCGKKMWKKEKKVVNQFECIWEELTDPVLTELEARFNGFAVVAVVIDTIDCVYFGYGAGVSNFEQARIPLPGVDGPDLDIEGILKEVLGKYGIWEQCKDSFGMWVVSEGK